MVRWMEFENGRSQEIFTQAIQTIQNYQENIEMELQAGVTKTMDGTQCLSCNAIKPPINKHGNMELKKLHHHQS